MHRRMSVVGRTAEDICSIRVLPIWTLNGPQAAPIRLHEDWRPMPHGCFVPDGFNISASIDPLDFTIIRSTTRKVRWTYRASPATSDFDPCETFKRVDLCTRVLT